MGTSAQAGFITPRDHGTLDDQGPLDAFIQTMVVGLTGISGNLVRPRWQLEPPTLPDISQTWVAVGRGRRRPDTFAFVRHKRSADGQGEDLVARSEEIEFNCSFYGPQAELRAVFLSMGFQVGQNREVLTQKGFGFINLGDIIT